MNELSSEEKFWRIVEDCLTELHGLPRSEAATQWKALLLRLQAHPEPGIEELTYHYEPLYIANDLAGRDLNDDEVGDRYHAIQARYWPEFYAESGAAQPTSA